MATVKVRGGPDKILNVLRGAGYDVRHLELDQHQRKHQLLPWWSRWSTPPTNYVGTFIFLSYFAVAVYLILLVVNHNIRPLLVTALQDQHRGLGSEVRRSLAFVLAGFAITSLNMINVLHQSYATHRAGTGSTTSLESIWSWMLETSLFRDFASDLMGGDDVAFWTRLSLAASAVMALHMRALASRYKIRRLWAYFALAQILPSTFAWLLLQLEVHLHRRLGLEKHTKHSPSSSSSNTTTKAAQHHLKQHQPITPPPSPPSYIGTTTTILYMATTLTTLWTLFTPRASVSQHLGLFIFPIRALLALPYFLPSPPLYPAFALSILPTLYAVSLVRRVDTRPPSSDILSCLGRVHAGVLATPAAWALSFDLFVGLFWTVVAKRTSGHEDESTGVAERSKET